MHRLPVWLCCLALIGCELRVNVDSKPNQPEVITATKHLGFTELKYKNVTAHVNVLNTIPPMTETLTIDGDEKSAYISRTEHDCSEHTSTLKYLALLDDNAKIIAQDDTLNVELDIEPDSLGEAEYRLACGVKGMV